MHSKFLGVRFCISLRKIVSYQTPLKYPQHMLIVGGGVTRQNIVMTSGMEKLEWCGYPMVKIFLKI